MRGADYRENRGHFPCLTKISAKTNASNQLCLWEGEQHEKWLFFPSCTNQNLTAENNPPGPAALTSQPRAKCLIQQTNPSGGSTSGRGKGWAMARNPHFIPVINFDRPFIPGDASAWEDHKDTDERTHLLVRSRAALFFWQINVFPLLFSHWDHQTEGVGLCFFFFSGLSSQTCITSPALPHWSLCSPSAQFACSG